MVLGSNWQLISEVYYGSISGYDELYLQLWGRLESQSITDNTSTITLYMRMNNTKYYANSGNCYATIDGTVVQNNSTIRFASNTFTDLGSVQRTITHNNDGTATNIEKSGRFRSYGMSEKVAQGTFDLPKIPRYANVTIAERSKTLNTISVNYNTDAVRDYTQYSLNGGNWTDASDTTAPDNKSGYFTITGLEKDTIYTIKVRVRRADSQLWSESNTISIRTYEQAVISSAPSNVTIGDDFTVQFSNPSGATAEIALFQGGTTEIVPYSRVYGTSGSYTFNLTQAQVQSIYGLIPSSTAVILRVYITTFEGNNVYYNYKEITFNIDLSKNKPAFSNFDLMTTDDMTKNLSGNTTTIIKNISTVKVKIALADRASGVNGSSISGYRITCGNTTVVKDHSTTSDVETSFSNVTNQVVTVTAVDSRGQETIVQKSLNFVPYEYPEFISRKIERNGGVGTKVLFDVEAKYWNGDFGARENYFLAAYYLFREKGGTWSNWIEITNFFTYFTSNGKIKSKEGAYFINADGGVQEFELGKEYEIQIYIEDLTTPDIGAGVAILNSGIPCTAKIKKPDGTYSMGVNTIPDPNYALDVNGNFRCAELRVYNSVGSWEPKLITFEGNGTRNEIEATYMGKSGRYVIIDKMIYVDFYLRLKITKLNGTDNFGLITGLPFSLDTNWFGQCGFSLGILYDLTQFDEKVTLIPVKNEIRIQTQNGTYANSLKVTTSDVGYSEIGGSGCFMLP